MGRMMEFCGVRSAPFGAKAGSMDERRGEGDGEGSRVGVVVASQKRYATSRPVSVCTREPSAQVLTFHSMLSWRGDEGLRVMGTTG